MGRRATSVLITLQRDALPLAEREEYGKCGTCSSAGTWPRSQLHLGDPPLAAIIVGPPGREKRRAGGFLGKVPPGILTPLRLGDKLSEPNVSGTLRVPFSPAAHAVCRIRPNSSRKVVFHVATRCTFGRYRGGLDRGGRLGPGAAAAAAAGLRRDGQHAHPAGHAHRHARSPDRAGPQRRPEAAGRATVDRPDAAGPIDVCQRQFPRDHEPERGGAGQAPGGAPHQGRGNRQAGRPEGRETDRRQAACPAGPVAAGSARAWGPSAGRRSSSTSD